MGNMLWFRECIPLPVAPTVRNVCVCETSNIVYVHMTRNQLITEIPVADMALSSTVSKWLFSEFQNFHWQGPRPPQKKKLHDIPVSIRHSRVFNDWDFSIISIPVRPLKAWFPTWIFWEVCLFGPKGTAQPCRNSFISGMNIFWLLGPAFPVQLRREYMSTWDC